MKPPEIVLVLVLVKVAQLQLQLLITGIFSLAVDCESDSWQLTFISCSSESVD